MTAGALVAALGSWAMPSSAAAVQTLTTTYAYNADGAVTAFTVHRAGAAPVTTYLTWDNFTPDATAPSTGRVQAGNGNLLGRGATPGVADEFAYDVRSRLVECQAAAQPAVAYTYHPASLMASSTLASGDALQFYHGTGAAAPMLNLRQPSNDTTASFLGPAYYLSDGSERVMLTPRKDVAASYDPAAARFTPYAYEPFGSAPTAPAGSALSDGGASYDLGTAPFRYAGEYADPACSGAYYLRARWYLSAQQTFLSRDPVDIWQRYGYTGGNPVNRIDPTGLSYASFGRGVNGFMRRLGAWDTVLQVLPGTGELMFAVQLSANLGGVIHSPSDLAMLAVQGAAALSEGGELVRDLGPIERGLRSTNGGFLTRSAIDFGVGGVQGVLAGFDQASGRRFSSGALVQSIEYTAGTTIAGRFVLGFGYRPYALSADEVDSEVREHLASPSGADTQLVYVLRQRKRVGPLTVGGSSPLAELIGSGLYHEGIYAPGPAGALYTSQRVAYVEGERFASTQVLSAQLAEGVTRQHAGLTEALLPGHRTATREYLPVGPVDIGRVQQVFARHIPELDSHMVADFDSTRYRNGAVYFTNRPSDSGTSHQHVNAVLRGLRP